MSKLKSMVARYTKRHVRKSVATTHSVRRRLESLEDRVTPATISIADATAIEGGSTIQPLGAFVSTGLPGQSRPHSMILGPDGNLYVSIHNESGAVYRYDAATGSPLPAPGKSGAEFVSPGSGGLTFARDMAFGPDGDLYALSEGTNSVLRYDPTTGAFEGVFVASGAGGLDAPRDFLFHDGYLYVTSVGPLEPPGPAGTDSVLRYDATTGAPAGLSGQPNDAVFITSGSGGLDNPGRLAFGPDGMVYVCSTAPTAQSFGANSILRYDSSTGAPAGVSGQPGDAFFVFQGSGGLDGPTSMVFRPDGYVYVASWRNDSVFRYHATTGDFAGTVVPDGSGGVDAPIDLLFEPDGNILVTSWQTGQVLRYGAGSQAAFTVNLSAASAVSVTVHYATANGTALSGSDYSPATGTITFAPGEISRTILVQTTDDALAEGAETFFVNLSNPVGAMIGDGQGVGTIFDRTKFYVVDDAATNRTYEYGTTGLATENYALNGGNTAPRGAASTAAGTTVWVVDANRTVYIYSAAGALLGSWSAGGLNPSTQVEGITTNGTDIWLVDTKQDKVFRYAGAASRLSGSQNAVSSFSLNNGNKNPKDLVTDGTSIWVVEDGSTDKVFKYTLSGSLLGSWTITGGGGSPTGITLDPSNAQQHLWIVDSATDRVYQYDNARNRTSGSQVASATFALASGNANPQGIADPPTISIADATATEGSVAIRFIDNFVPAGSGGLDRPYWLTYGPDGNLYVSGHLNTDAIFRYDAVTGAPLPAAGQSGAIFVPPGSGGLQSPRMIRFGPGGDLYVSSELTHSVLRFDGVTGAFEGVLVASGAGGLIGPRDLVFHTDGFLYVVSTTPATGPGSIENAILRYNAINGAPAGISGQPGDAVFVASGSGGLDNPSRLLFHTDGRLYVTSTRASTSNSILRYSAGGAFIDAFVPTSSGGLNGPVDMYFAPDGYLYVTSWGNDRVMRFSGSTGAYVNDAFPPGSGGLDAPICILPTSGGNFLIPSWNNARVLRYGSSSQAVFAVTMDAPSATPVNVNFSTAPGTALAGSDFVTNSGTLTFAPGQTTRTILVRTLDDALHEGEENFFVNLSNPTGATIADGQAVGTITDNDSVRVAATTINDGSAQRSRVTSLTVTFNSPVEFAGPIASALALTRIGGGSVEFSASSQLVNGVTVVTLSNFTGAETQHGSLADGRYTLTALAGQISVGGVLLDGNGDGNPGDNFVLIGTPANGLFRLFGDGDGDGSVSAVDFNAFRLSYGTSSLIFDCNGDNEVNASDFAQFRLRFGISIAP